MKIEDNPEEIEYRRIKRLNGFNYKSYDLQNEFAGLVKLSASIAGTRFCNINFIDNYFQWTIASEGSNIQVIPREESICNLTILGNEPLEINRLDQDTRFKDKSYVSCQDGLKYYLGIPLALDSGENIGALCVFDTEEKKITGDELEQLKLIAGEIIGKLESMEATEKTKIAVAEAETNMKRLAHDIRSPLSGISQLCEVLSKDEISSTEFYSYLEMIGKTSTSILELSDDILKKDKRSIFAYEDTYSLQDFGERLNSLYEIPARTKKLDFHVSFNEEYSQTRFVRKKLFSAAGNLISNSIKFTPEGGWVKVLLNVSKVGPEKKLLITVTDNGLGIMNSLPNDGDNLNSSGNKSGHKQSYGIGLKLVREVVENCSGKITIDTGKNEGTEIKLEIPIL